MRFPSPGHCRTVADLRARLQQLGTGFDVDDAVTADGPLAQPATVFGRTLPNRFATHPMEGWDGTADGAPTPLVLRRWRHFGHSSAALIWGGEAFAVRPGGRANAHQLCLGPESEGHLRALLAELRAGRAEVGGDPAAMLVGLQLTHSGRFCRPLGPLLPQIAQRHPLLASKYSLAPDHPLLSDGELEGIAEDYVRAAAVAQRAGFDFVDVKCCHGYLLHEVLASKTRPGPYGGSFANRTRLFLRIVAAIRSACPGLHLGVRLSAADTAPFQANAATRVGEAMALPGVRASDHHFGVAADDATAFDLAETLAFLRLLPPQGIGLLNVTLGSPYWNPHLQRPAGYPPSDGYLPPVDPLLMVGKHFATAAALKQAVPQLLLVGTGYTYMQEWVGHAAQQQLRLGHVDFVGLGRMLLSYPELPLQLLAGKAPDRRRLCRTFSDCTTAPRNGMVSGCYPLDAFYGDRPEAAKVQQLSKDMRA
jgi:2,4-dienoyl-CoA reductase-like NADH-dependent reductase (Old Yellow Enzyme family)